MKNYMMIAVSLTLSSLAFSQTLEEARKKTDNERFGTAAQDYRTLIAKEPANGTIYFYYGENFFQQGEPDSAIATWQKGASVDAVSPLAMVGLGKAMWCKGDTAAAHKQFNTALTATKNKNAEVMRQVGAAYTYGTIKNLDGAISILENSTKLEPKNIDGYLILGDALLEKTPAIGGPAIKNYNKALDIDPKSSKATVRKAHLYQRGQNYEEANKMYKEAQALDPTYAPAYRENAELNMMFDQSTKAIENWKKYLELNNSDEARYRFATALFTGKKYCEVIPELDAIEANGFYNFYTKRMLTYALYECNEQNDKAINERGIAESDKFFEIAPKDKIISSDYRYRGMHYSKLGSDSLAIGELEKASVTDTSKAKELLGDIGRMYMKMKKYDKTIAVYEQKKNGDPANLNATETFELARAYYFGPKDYTLADTNLAYVIEKAPEYSLAYLWRGRSSNNLDIDPKNRTWKAKPYYEKYTQLIAPADRAAGSNKNYMLEASRYLGDYYVNNKENKDLVKAKEYWTIVQELDPADKQAKIFFASPAGK